MVKKQKMGLLLLFAAVMGVGCATGDPAAMEAEDWKLVWSDEFDGEKLDPAKWNFVTGGGGYGNNESQYYTDDPANVTVRDGCLVITSREEERDGYPYTSAKITTEGKGEWTYGRFDFRVRLPQGQGIWPAIWMMPPDMRRYGGWPRCGEIDILEMVGNAPSTVHGTLHYGNPWLNAGGSYSLEDGSVFADAFHDFSMTWEPGRFRWYVDGALYHTETNWYTSGKGARWPAPFDRPFYLQLNLAVGGNWPGYPDASTTFPQELIVDYARVYQYLGEYAPVPDRPAMPVHLRPRDPRPDGNLVYNHDFSGGMKEWELSVHEGGKGSASAVDGEFRVDIEKPGAQPWSVQVTQRPLGLTRGRPYELSFRARSDRPRKLGVNVGKASQPWSSYSGKRTVELGTEFTSYEIAFTMHGRSDPLARLEFNAGNREGPVWVDDVVLREGGEVQSGATVVDGAVRIEAEAFTDATGVNTESCVEGGSNVGWIETGDRLSYLLDVKKPGSYELCLRHAGESAAGRLRVCVNGVDAAQMDLPATGGWQTWTNASTVLTLDAGEVNLELVAGFSGINLNWLSLTPE